MESELSAKESGYVTDTPADWAASWVGSETSYLSEPPNLTYYWLQASIYQNIVDLSLVQLKATRQPSNLALHDRKSSGVLIILCHLGRANGSVHALDFHCKHYK